MRLAADNVDGNQEDNEDEESPVQSFREGWADVVAGNTIPASRLWE